MYSISNFETFTDQPLESSTQVLVWSKSTGYFFTTFSLVSEELIIMAVNI